MNSKSGENLYIEADRQIQFDAALMECIDTLHSGEDINEAIDKLLGIVADFHKADRAYIFEIDWKNSTINNTYEWCRDGVEPEIDKLQNLDISIIDRWMVQFEEKGEFYLNSRDGELDKESDEYQILAMQEIESLMAAPLKLDEQMKGFIGVDNPCENTDTLALMRAVASFVANDIQKRIAIEHQIISAIANIYHSMHLINLLEDTQREFQSSAGVRRYVNQKDGAAEQMRMVMRNLTAKEYVEDILEFAELETLAERMKETDNISHEFLAYDGHWCRASFIVVGRNEDGGAEQVLYAVQYIDKEKQRELEYQRALKQALENQNAMYFEMLQIQSGGVIAIGAETGDIVMINDAALKMFGYQSKEEFDGKIATLDGKIAGGDMTDWISHFKTSEIGAGPFPYEFTVEVKDEHRYILSNSKLALLANGEKIIILTLTDVTEREKMEQKLRFLSRTDALTQISNRGSGEKQIEDLLENDVAGMFCLFDIDNFKAVNDSFGHIVGDKVLMEIASCLKNSFGEEDVVMRLGGDEFAVYALGVENEEDGKARIQSFFDKVVKVGLDEMNQKSVSVSLGAVLRPKNSVMGFDELYQKADSAMYICKNNKGNYFRFFQAEETG